MPRRISDIPEEQRIRLQAARDPVLIGAAAVLLICAPLFPGLSRIVVLPALLLAPGFAFLRLLGQARYRRSISVAVPVSIVLIVCAALLLDVSGIKLDPSSLGSLLGAVTAVSLAGSYVHQSVDSTPGLHRKAPANDQQTAPGGTATSEWR